MQRKKRRFDASFLYVGDADHEKLKAQDLFDKLFVAIQTNIKAAQFRFYITFFCTR
jgi:hypothetical protein